MRLSRFSRVWTRDEAAEWLAGDESELVAVVAALLLVVDVTVELERLSEFCRLVVTGRAGADRDGPGWKFSELFIKCLAALFISTNEMGKMPMRS